jgi:hypothetical protein
MLREHMAINPEEITTYTDQHIRQKKNVKAGKHENAAIWVWQLYTRA